MARSPPKHRQRSRELSDKATTLVLGVGNVILGDEGFGPEVVRRLSEAALPAGVRVEEGGVGGFNLLGSLEGVERLIVVDVMLADIPPGEIRLFRLEPGSSAPGQGILSFHQVGVPELLELWRLLGHEPETYFLVTRPEKLAWGEGLSAPVRRAVAGAVEMVREIAANNFAALERSLSRCLP
jgi:hydrogenase maturation protease